MFPCERCGACCRQVGTVPFGKGLALPSGVCRHWDEHTKLCSIYKTRPLICRVDEAYERCLQDKMTRREYYRLNKEACQRLRMNLKDKGE